jgi:hypothetical protein
MNHFKIELAHGNYGNTTARSKQMKARELTHGKQNINFPEPELKVATVLKKTLI